MGSNIFCYVELIFGEYYFGSQDYKLDIKGVRNPARLVALGPIAILTCLVKILQATVGARAEASMLNIEVELNENNKV